MESRSGVGRGDPNDTGRPARPVSSCPCHPGVMTSGACPACLREAARQEPTQRPREEDVASERRRARPSGATWNPVRHLRQTLALV